MADRVHPSNTAEEVAQKPAPPVGDKPVPPPGTYVVQIPKDQIYRIPPPENAAKYNKYSRRKPRRNPCCVCLCWILGLFTLLIVLTAIAAGILYLVFRPESPNYSVENLSINGLNLSSSSQAISPEFDVTVRAENPNDKIGIYYEKGSSVKVYYSGINLCNGVLPAFYQPSNNVTIFQTALTGPGVVLSSTDYQTLMNQQREGKVPFKLKLRVPVKLKVGSVKSWTITVKVSCDITVNGLTAKSGIVSKDCDVSVKPWWTK